MSPPSCNQGARQCRDTLDRLDTVEDSGATQPIADYDSIGAWRVAERAYPIVLAE